MRFTLSWCFGTAVWLYIAQLMEKAMATHSSTLAWEIPWVEEPGRLQSMELQRVRHDWATSLSLFTFMHWRRRWQPTLVFFPGESQGREPGGLLSMGSRRVGHDWPDLAAVAAAQLSVLNSLWTSKYGLRCVFPNTFSFTEECRRLITAVLLGTGVFLFI